MNARSPYPRYFRNPEGRAVSIAAMAKALKMVRADPDREFRGWDWFPVPGHFVLKSFRAGMHDRINQRGALAAAK